MREATYGVLTVLGFVVPWIFNVQFLIEGGNFLDLGIWSGLFASPLTGSLTADLLIAFAAFGVFVVTEARRIGMRFGWAYFAVAWITAFAFAFPLFLWMRERHLRSHPG